MDLTRANKVTGPTSEGHPVTKNDPQQFGSPGFCSEFPSPAVYFHGVQGVLGPEEHYNHWLNDDPAHSPAVDPGLSPPGEVSFGNLQIGSRNGSRGSFHCCHGMENIQNGCFVPTQCMQVNGDSGPCKNEIQFADLHHGIWLQDPKMSIKCSEFPLLGYFFAGRFQGSNGRWVLNSCDEIAQ